ncbi:MAG: ABC transporter permease [Flammeovirgaceae bacterium]|nr:ABC transporter permease [Flammeovirgaceae bacterium]
MNLIENFKEGLRSVQANLLRSVLTALIVAIGITSLVGILTAIDGIEQSVSSSLGSLGVNSFEISSKWNRGGSSQGVKERVYTQLTLNECNRFISEYKVPSNISLSATVTSLAEVKFLSEKTNPNVWVMGVNEHYAALKGLTLKDGRNFSKFEVDQGSHVVLVGNTVYKNLFKNGEKGAGSALTILGTQFKVIGILEKKGDFGEENYDNMVMIPIRVANQLSSGRRNLWYRLQVDVSRPDQVEYAMGEARGVLRSIRHDRIGDEDSFDLEKSESLSESLDSITSGLRYGGFGVGFVTLLGASIALMNIMLVSVTERTREVGVRKALGATPLRIRQQFVIEAIVVCILGGIAGVILGIIIGNVITSIMNIKIFVIPWLWMLVGMLICVFVGLISGYYPAYKASKLDPIESLRFE